MIVSASFLLIHLFPVRQIPVFRVVQQQVFHAEPLGQLAGILHRGVVLFIGGVGWLPLYIH
jgi:hypothetical protein